MLLDQLQKDQIIALKSKEQERLDTLRFLLAQIKNKEIEKRTTLTDSEVLSVIQKFALELHESIQAFEKAERNDLVEKSKTQLSHIQKYLPAELTDEELEKKIKTLFEEHSAELVEKPKMFIGICMKALKNQASGNRILTELKKQGRA